MTPTEAIASIRASIAAGYSPSLSDIEVLIAECGRVEALEGKAKAAFDEGYEFGHGDGYRDLITGPEPCWSRSKAKAALTQAEEKGK